MTDEQLRADLVHLGVDRAYRGIGTVMQLTDDPATRYSILISVAASTLKEAATLLVSERRAPSVNAGVAHILKEILDEYGIDWRSQRKAKK